jgi:DNA-directed RNA polymerase specialized sigma24 family protein
MIRADRETDLLWFWDSGFNTIDIATAFGITEAEAERRVWRARELRRNARRGIVNEFAC